jgi:hypothetical protein
MLLRRFDMIRFFAGFILVMGGVGGIEDIAAPVLPGFLIAVLGLAFMAWPILDGTVETDNERVE